MTEQQTPDREKKIAEIREALEKATPEPWKLVMDSYDDEKDTYFPWMIINADGEEICDFSGGGDVKLENAHIMTNAPEWLRFLLDELEGLEQERNMYKSSSEVFYERLKIRDELLEQLRAQIKYYFGGDGGLAKLQDGVNKLLRERQRLIDGLLTIMDIASEDRVHWKLDRCYTTARDILKEIEVTVEWQKSVNDMRINR